MLISFVFLWALVGLSVYQPHPDGDTRPPQPTTNPRPPQPPDPRLISRLIGLAGGVIGGLLYVVAFGSGVNSLITRPQPEPWSLVDIAATALGAFIGARLLVDISGLVRGRRG